MNRLTAAVLSAPLLLLLSGGCSVFRYDKDDEAPPPLTKVPKPRPSTETGSFDSVGGSFHEIFIDFPGRVWDNMFGTTASVQAQDMESDQPDRRRLGLVSLTDRPFGKAPPYTTRYKQIAQFDTSPLVRATALRSLNRSRDESATGIMIAALDDESPLVRLEAAKGLANLPNSNAAGPLLKVFTNPKEEVDVRIAAADALGYYRRLEVARALTPRLAEHDFSVAWQARRSLCRLTGRDYFYNEAAWLEYITGPDKPFG